MPFKKLAGAKKLANLGAEVVGIAPLEGGSIVAAVTTDPVKVSVHPIGAGNHRVTNVSLDEAQSAALFDKKVAVVKSGDDLWALLDIQHTPKIEQVGRDIRSLHACPKGGTALAVGWDGNGAALALQNNEVGGRQFVLRGDVRTASLTTERCYVVVDGGGGQLREHPGGTPESGALARGDLPPEAAGLDVLAGGQELCALAKRGGSSVCVIRREGAQVFGAKMIDVPSVVDVAVIATSLFVLGADGRLRLYDSETLAGGPDMSPTFELSVGGDGAPTTLVSTQKGGNKLWIGTAAGDVIRVDAVKGNLEV
ncbi:MAG TPA: hypothetical protein ENK57_12790 [Polyangiaceae bacterium]|nr:hypothetical protein [Polyangiaceae bacterium]